MLQRLLLSFSALLLVATAAHAERVEVTLDTKLEVRSAIGLLLSSQGAQQVRETDVHQASEILKLVSFPYLPDKVTPDTVASALVVLEDGSIAFANVRPILKGQRDAKSFASLPDCEPEEATRVSVHDQFGLFESLVEIRSARREVNQIKIKKILAGPFLEKLKRLERGFGLAHPDELSADLPAAELVDRLSRLATAIRSYNRSKVQSGKSPK